MADEVMWDQKVTQPLRPSDLHLPRLSLEFEFLISGYGCFGDWEGTHFGVNEAGSLEHTLC
jgi:hypothetical protein